MSESTERFIDDLISQMTLDEKVGQLNQVYGANQISPENIRNGSIGSFLNASGTLNGQEKPASSSVELINRLQQIALESRLKIPLLIGRDVIHGYRTIFPIPLAQAASFNPELAGMAASIAAQEATADGIKWTFAPMLDIARDPRWGRVAEGNGEDPYLGAQMAKNLVLGYQGDDLAKLDKLVACAKHYIGYGSAEGGRDYENGEISEPTLRDIYCPPFKSAVEAGVGTVMSAFLDLNGIPATANRRLLSDVLRSEWGFDGFVVSDWASVAELIHHGVVEDRTGAAIAALHAGVDMEMVTGTYQETLASSVQAGRASIGEVDEAVHRILRIKQRAGLFDNPFTDPSRSSRDVLTDKSLKIARQFARECMVLLKNRENILPFKNFRKILIAGDFINAQSELFGTWSLDGCSKDVRPLGQVFREVAPKEVELRFKDMSEKALTNALAADAVVLLLGEHPNRSGENANISDLRLPPGQSEFVELMVSSGKPLVLVVFAGRPLVLTREVDKIDALLYAWHPGIEGAAALAEILFGISSPTGRLPITFPRATGQVPIYYNHKNSGRPITAEGEFNTRYLDLSPKPLFPFGYGLSYTSFVYTDMVLSDPIIRGSIEVKAEVTNTGRLPGSELVQLYVRDLVGSLTRPVRELKGFTRIELQPGETQTVTFTLSEEMLAFTRADGTKGVEPGRYQVWIAPDSTSGLSDEFRL